jgi:hypothetical protein
MLEASCGHTGEKLQHSYRSGVTVQRAHVLAKARPASRETSWWPTPVRRASESDMGARAG